MSNEDKQPVRSASLIDKGDSKPTVQAKRPVPAGAIPKKMNFVLGGTAG